MRNNIDALIYTDGSCIKNPGGPGGAGAIIQLDGFKDIELDYYEPKTTNNRMEMMAAILGLEFLPGNRTVVLFSDSTYVINGITSWVRGWEKAGWVKSDGEPVKNVDLWLRMIEVTRQYKKIHWNWVKGHAGNPGNERADYLAGAVIRRNLGIPEPKPKRKRKSQKKHFIVKYT